MLEDIIKWFSNLSNPFDSCLFYGAVVLFGGPALFYNLVIEPAIERDFAVANAFQKLNGAPEVRFRFRRVMPLPIGIRRLEPNMSLRDTHLPHDIDIKEAYKLLKKHNFNPAVLKDNYPKPKYPISLPST